MSANSSDKGIGLSMMMFGVAIVLIVVIKAATSGLLAAGPADMSDAAVAERIAPAGSLNTGDPIAPVAAAAPAAATGGAPRSGEEVYNSACMACHTSGAAGAPIMGNAEAWSPRIAKGMDTLMNHAVNGFNAMPPRGTCANCSDDELKAAIEFMVDQSGGAAATESAPAAEEASAPALEPAPVEAEAPAAAAAPAGRSADMVYNRYCIACHAAGVAGAPRLGDAAAWAPRAAKGMEGLMGSATNGLNAMPPRGTCMDCSDAELQNTIQFMLDSSK